MTKKQLVNINDIEWGNIQLPGLDDDTLLNTNWNLKKTKAEKEKIRARYESMSDQDRKILKKNIALGWSEKQGTLTIDQKRELFYEAWTCPRSKEDISRLCKKYNLKESAFKSAIAEGKYVDPVEAKRLKKEWENTYGYCIEVRSPGNDLLEFYDEQNLLRGKSQRNYVPPSVIYQIRFSKVYLTTKDIYEIAKPYYDTEDMSFYKNLRKNRLSWLVDKPSVRKICYSQEEAVEYVKSMTGAKTVEYTIHSKASLGWHGKLAGWSFIKKQRGEL